MIFVDTSAFYALSDRRDVNHEGAKGFYETHAESQPLATSLPVVTETWLVLRSRMGDALANRFIGHVAMGLFLLLEVDLNVIAHSVEISNQYVDANLGFADSTSFALMERHKLVDVFTFDRRHFSLYKPAHTAYLNLLPHQP